MDSSIKDNFKKTEKLTEELLKELLDHPRIDDYLENEDFSSQNFSSLLKEYTSDAGLECKDIIKRTNLNATHCYQIYSGDRGVSRNKLLQISLAIHLTYKQCNRLLHAAGVSALYCKNRRDAIYIFCLKNDYSVNKTNDTLYNFNEDTLDT